MSIKPALKGQYLAGLSMLRHCIERCPEDVWTAGTHPRNFWRIAYHAVFYTHFYLQQNVESFKQWEKYRESATNLWGPQDVEEPYTREEMLEYIDLVISGVSDTMDELDLESEETGFPWYKNMNKLEHELMNVRHLQGHVGQLSELLMARNVDTDWVGKAKP